VKKTALLISALSLTGCASMTDVMDSAAGMGKITIETNKFDNSKIIALSPDKLYNPDGGFSSIDTELGAIWSSSTPNYVTIVLNDEGSSSYTSFSSLSININNSIKEYQTGSTQFDNGGYNHLVNSIFTNSNARISIPLSEFKAMLASENCLLKISRSEGYEVASCTKDRIPGGKKTAILGFRKILTAIEENAK
jgi:hypothetical protein